MHPSLSRTWSRLEPLRLAAALAHVLPGTSVVVGDGAVEPPLPALREALAGVLAGSSPDPVVQLLGPAGEVGSVPVGLRHGRGGVRPVGGGLYEAAWAGATTCLFATVLPEAQARRAVREAATFPQALDGVPVKALGLGVEPRRVAVVRDEPTATTVFGLDRSAASSGAVTTLVRAAMTAAAAACLTAELISELGPLEAPRHRPGG